MLIKPTALRKNLFSCLDLCLNTGEVLEVERSGKLIRISADRKRTPVADLPGHPGALADPGSLAEFSPSEWNGA